MNARTTALSLTLLAATAAFAQPTDGSIVISALDPDTGEPNVFFVDQTGEVSPPLLPGGEIRSRVPLVRISSLDLVTGDFVITFIEEGVSRRIRVLDGGGNEDLWQYDPGLPDAGGVVSFDNPLVAFDNPLVAFDNPLVAFKPNFIGFDNPLVAFKPNMIGFDNPLVAFDNPLVAFNGNELVFFTGIPERRELFELDVRSDIHVPVPRGWLANGGEFLEGLWGGLLSYDESGPGIVYTPMTTDAMIAGQGVSQAWTGDGPIRERFGSAGSLALNPWTPGDMFLGGMTIGLVPEPIIVRVTPDREQSVVLLGSDIIRTIDDMIVLDESTLLVVDTSGGSRGQLVKVNMDTGEETVFVDGGARMIEPTSVSVIRCAPVSFSVLNADDEPDRNPGDGVPNDGFNATLRGCVMEANLAPCGGATIVLPDGLFTLTQSGAGEDGSVSGDLDISAYVRIKGDGPTSTIIDAAELDRVFHVLPGGTLVLEGVTLRGGLVSGEDGGLIFNRGRLSLINVELTGATADSGGGVASFTDLDAPTPSTELFRTDISDTHAAAGAGGALALVGGSNNISYSSFSACSAAIDGGAVFLGRGFGELFNATVSGNTAAGAGGGVATFQSDLAVRQATIASNTGGVGGGLVANTSSRADIGSSILADNTDDSGPNDLSPGPIPAGDEVFNSEGHSLIEAAVDATLSGDLTGVIEGVDPRLEPVTLFDGLRAVHPLGPGSPAIDAGAPTSMAEMDQVLLDRVVDGDGDSAARMDMGAHELREPHCIADFNQDGSVNTLDVLAFLNAWTAGDPAADVNGDGSVNTLDVLFFLNAWTAGC